MENGGAEKAGITKGCIITGIEGSGINNMESLQEQLSYYRIGETVTLTVQFPAGQENTTKKSGCHVDRTVKLKGRDAARVMPAFFRVRNKGELLDKRSSAM